MIFRRCAATVNKPRLPLFYRLLTTKNHQLPPIFRKTPSKKRTKKTSQLVASRRAGVFGWARNEEEQGQHEGAEDGKVLDDVKVSEHGGLAM